MRKKNFDYVGKNAHSVGTFLSQNNFYFVDSCAKTHSQGNISQELRIMIKFVIEKREEYFESVKRIKEEMIKESNKKRIEDFENQEEIAVSEGEAVEDAINNNDEIQKIL